jgi:DNA-binding winged helix-turn-helix (wHTH) protein
MQPVQNPFFHRGPIRQSDHFFNRQREIGQALGLLRNLQNVALVGQRRIGKTSLLFHLANPTIHRDHGLTPTEYLFVHLDGEALTELNDGLIRAVMAEEVVATLEEAGHQRPDLVLPEGPIEFRTFRQMVRRLTQRGLKLILCLDEFEGFGANPHLGPSFFSSLRSLSGQLDVAFVTASRTPIHTLAYAQPETLSSPFFNTFAPLHLGLFSDEEARRLVETLASRAGAAFSPDLVDLIVELAGPHPLLLQIAGFHTFETWQQQDGLVEKGAHDEMQHHFYIEAQPHYEYYWQHLSAEEQYTLATLPLAQQSQELRRNLRALEQQCLVTRRDDGYDYISAAFQAFVRQQLVPDLLQAGPFVIDLRQRLASCQGAPLSVTKTELDALAYFSQNTGRVITPQELEEALWPGEYVEDPERVRSLIKSLRKALGSEADCLVTRWGVGYLFQVPG